MSGTTLGKPRHPKCTHMGFLRIASISGGGALTIYARPLASGATDGRACTSLLLSFVLFLAVLLH